MKDKSQLRPNKIFKILGKLENLPKNGNLVSLITFLLICMTCPGLTSTFLKSGYFIYPGFPGLWESWLKKKVN